MAMVRDKAVQQRSLRPIKWMWLLLSAAHAVCWVTYLAKLKPGLVITMILLRSDGNGMDMLLLLLVGGGMAKKAGVDTFGQCGRRAQKTSHLT